MSSKLAKKRGKVKPQSSFFSKAAGFPVSALLGTGADDCAQTGWLRTVKDRQKARPCPIFLTKERGAVPAFWTIIQIFSNITGVKSCNFIQERARKLCESHFKGSGVIRREQIAGNGYQTGGVPWVWKLSTVFSPQACPFMRSACVQRIGFQSGASIKRAPALASSTRLPPGSHT